MLIHLYTSVCTRLRRLQVGFGLTGRTCADTSCSAPLADNILDWDSPLPDNELHASEEHAKAAVRWLFVIRCYPCTCPVFRKNGHQSGNADGVAYVCFTCTHCTACLAGSSMCIGMACG